MQRTLPILLIVILLFASCNNCEKYTKNYVIDKETRKPIFGVWVFSVAATDGKQESEQWIHTDSFGVFEALYTKSGTSKCPVLKLTLTKDGYYPLRVWDPVLGDSLVMQKINN